MTAEHLHALAEKLYYLVASDCEAAGCHASAEVAREAAAQIEQLLRENEAYIETIRRLTEGPP